MPGHLHSKCSCFVGSVPRFPLSYVSFDFLTPSPVSSGTLQIFKWCSFDPSILLTASAYVITLHEIKPTKAKSNPSLVGAGSQSLARLGGVALWWQVNPWNLQDENKQSRSSCKWFSGQRLDNCKVDPGLVLLSAWVV